MEYLKEYNLSEEDIKDIISNIDFSDTIELDLHKDKVCDILDYFKSKNIINIKELLMYKTEIFYSSLEYLKRKIDTLDTDSLNKLKEDITLFDQIV